MTQLENLKNEIFNELKTLTKQDRIGRLKLKKSMLNFLLSQDADFQESMSFDIEMKKQEIAFIENLIK